jgi:hypothetical protein
MKATVTVNAQGRMTIPAEDAWAYTPEHVAKVRKAEAELDAGKVIRMGPNELRAYLGLPPAAEDVDGDDE